MDTEMIDEPADTSRRSSLDPGGPGSTSRRRSDGGPFRRVMSLRDFRLLVVATSTSMLGDQFALIATPWLVLQLTGDPLAVGIVLALEGIPRAAFMLIGGAVTDRLAPRLIMLISDIVRLGLTAVMAGAVFAGTVQMWMVYALALSFGLVAGFATPAEKSIVPMLVSDDDLQAGNSLVMGVTQFAGFVGPTLAGLAIAVNSRSELGIGLAFLIDAVTFAVSTGCLWLMRGARSTSGDEREAHLWKSIRNGITYLWRDRALRLVFLVLAAINFLVVGPLLVGIPVVAHERLPGGAMAFGLLMAAFSVGNLVGYVVAGALPRPSSRVVRAIVVGLFAGNGMVVASLSLLSDIWPIFGLLLLLGLGNGYLAIVLFTWIQTYVSRSMLGRMMSLVTFSSLGLIPVSQAISGAVGGWSLDVLFLPSGGLVVLGAVWTSRRPGLRVFTDSLAAGPPNPDSD